MAARRRALTTLAMIATALVAPGYSVAAQRPRPPAPGVILVGSVVRADNPGTAAPYSSVELVEAHSRKFADDSGHFSFRIPPGTYHVHVRQIGFAPHDTIISLAQTVNPASLQVRMTALVIRLTDVHVKAQQTCTRPGVDSTDDPILYGFLAAIRENADRELLLRRAYPFEYTVEDLQSSSPDTREHPLQSSTDTLRYRSDAMKPYLRGETVFTDLSDPRGAWERMRLPSIVDFADSTFLGTHCFGYGIGDTGDYEINFRPLVSIPTPDVEGTVSLDTATFVIRSALVRLTHASAVTPGYERLEVKTTYREVLPRIAVTSVVASTQRYRVLGADGPLFSAVEIQSLRSLRFLGRVPAGVARTQDFPARKEANVEGGDPSP